MRPHITYGITGVVLHAVSPLALIWAINTLFNTAIPFSFKTWLAGLVLIYVVRFHMRVGELYSPLRFGRHEEEDDEDDEIYEFEIEDPDTRRKRPAKLEKHLRRFQEKRKAKEGQEINQPK